MNDNEFDFSDYPVVAGYKRTDTSAEAARDITPDTPRLRGLVLHLLDRAGAHGLTPEEAAEQTGIPRVSLQPRFSEGRRLGKIVDSGLRRPNPSSGKRAIVWVLPAYKQADAA